MARINFKEEQKFGSVSLYFSMGLIYIATLAFLMYAIIMQFVLERNWVDKQLSDEGLIILTILVVLILIVSYFMLFKSKLIVEVGEKSLFFSFYPYVKRKEIKAIEIKSFEIRKYKPLKEYGGSGIKKGVKNIGDAYSVTGNIGLQLYLTNGKKILFGTQKPDALKKAITKLLLNNL
jgi:hypothetical protein